MSKAMKLSILFSVYLTILGIFIAAYNGSVIFQRDVKQYIQNYNDNCTVFQIGCIIVGISWVLFMWSIHTQIKEGICDWCLFIIPMYISTCISVLVYGSFFTVPQDERMYPLVYIFTTLSLYMVFVCVAYRKKKSH